MHPLELHLFLPILLTKLILPHVPELTQVPEHGRKAKSIFRRGLDYLREILLNLESRMDELFQVLTFLSCT
jgi:hypothetical protein